MKIISLFNNKGGVGKTTYLYHIAHLLSENYNVLIVDCDSQCNLTSYSINDNEIIKSWKDSGNSIYQIVFDLIEGVGDFKKRKPYELKNNLWLVPGDIEFLLFEDKLANTWVRARGGEAYSLRLQTAIYRYINYLSNDKKMNFDIVLLDLGPNLGSLNRSLLISSDYFIVPATPDLFSIKGTENLGKRIEAWSNEWALTQEHKDSLKFDIPLGKPKFLGFVAQTYNMRSGNSENMTKGWATYGDILQSSIEENIVNKLKPLNQCFNQNDLPVKISQTPNLNSLVPYSMNAKKPVFDCTYDDGLRGAHIAKARESRKYFEPIEIYVKAILDRTV